MLYGMIHVRPSYLYNGNSCTSKTISLYQDGLTYLHRGSIMVADGPVPICRQNISSHQGD